MTIIEDTRQKPGEHELKRKYFKEQGYEIVRSKLPFGDYAAVPSISIDTKKDMGEIAGNICGKEHNRFINECRAARDAGCRLIILVENTEGIASIDQVRLWKNPRSVYSPGCVQGDRLEKAMRTISERYGCKFMFCTPEEAGRKIEEILNGEPTT